MIITNLLWKCIHPIRMVVALVLPGSISYLGNIILERGAAVRNIVHIFKRFFDSPSTYTPTPLLPRIRWRRRAAQHSRRSCVRFKAISWRQNSSGRENRAKEFLCARAYMEVGFVAGGTQTYIISRVPLLSVTLRPLIYGCWIVQTGGQPMCCSMRSLRCHQSSIMYDYYIIRLAFYWADSAD